MNAWFWLIPAAITEVGWVSGLRAASGFWGWSATALCALASLGLAMQAGRYLPATTVYILFVGIGSIGTALVDMWVFGTPLHASTWVFLVLLLVMIVGLKSTSSGGTR